LSFETGYRSKPPVDSIYSALVPDSVADPYAWFIEDNRQLSIDSRKAKGFDTSAIRKDIGHSWDRTSFEFFGNRLDFNAKPHPLVPPFEYRGMVLEGGPYGGFEALEGPNLGAFAVQRYARAASSGQVFDLANALGELREGLPRLIPDVIRGVGRYRNLTSEVMRRGGSDYLNVQFGWLPLLNDLQAIVKTFAMASAHFVRPTSPVHRLYQQAIPDVTSIYRSLDDFDKLTVSTTPNYSGIPAKYRAALLADGVNYLSPGNGNYFYANVYATENRQQRLWFEGEFSFFPKAGFNPESFMSRADELMNLDITPAVLWELAPWSWLVDWALHLGDALTALQSVQSDRVISTYAYAMAETKITRTIIGSKLQPQAESNYTGPSSALSVRRSTRKQRIRANPYGFTLGTNGGLNANQLGILGSLGLTKLR
jgi:hypothetical protein